jgi:hypothetical protein
MLPF